HRPSAQARRDALLRAAIEVAAERGAAGTTHRAVTQRAGLPLATASYFFSSIAELVSEALRTHVAEEAERLAALAAELVAGRRTPDELAAALAEAAMPRGPLPFTLAQFEAYLQAAATRRCGTPWPTRSPPTGRWRRPPSSPPGRRRTRRRRPRRPSSPWPTGSRSTTWPTPGRATSTPSGGRCACSSTACSPARARRPARPARTA